MSKLPATFDELVSVMAWKAERDRIPLHGVFELTDRCNLACTMCYVRLPAGERDAKARELSAEEWCALATSAAKAGTLFVLLTGGEIFLRQDFFKIYEPISELGLSLTLYTNATLVSERVADRLAERPPSALEVTLYGASQATYESVTKVKGSYRRCLSGIHRLRDRGMRVALKSTITRQNFADVPAMRAMAEELGVPFSIDANLVDRRDGSKGSVEECRVSCSECMALEHRVGMLDDGASQTRETSRDQATPGNVFYCGAGKGGYMLSPYGEMNVCIDLPRPRAMPLYDGFAHAWQQVQAFVDEAPAISDACKACGAQEYCVRCPAVSFTDSGSLTAPVRRICEMAWSRRSQALRMSGDAGVS